MAFRIFISGVFALYFATLSAACSQRPSLEALCKHTAKIAEQEGSADELAKCKSQLAGLKKELGDESFGKVASCLKKAKSKADLPACVAIASGSDEDQVSAYIAKSKSSEARQFLRKMYDGARAYYMDAPIGDSLAIVAPQLPAPSVGPTPPLGTCCENGGKCPPNPEYWQDATWQALMFEVWDPHYYSYEYKVKQEGDGVQFTVSAYGDLDCDGKYSTFRLTGASTPEGEISGPGELELVDELE